MVPHPHTPKMADTVQKGQGRRRQRPAASEWDTDPEETAQNDPKPTVLEPPKETNIEPINAPIEAPKTDYSAARDLSRSQYLEKRQAAKLEELSAELALLEGRKLTASEQREYSRKKRIYDAIRGVAKTESLEEASGYALPEEYLTAEGKIDRKRKHEALHASVTMDASNEPENRRRRYENQWETDQLRRAQIAGVGDELKLPDSDKWEFVFDEREYVDFEDDGNDQDDNPSGGEQETGVLGLKAGSEGSKNGSESPKVGDFSKTSNDGPQNTSKSSKYAEIQAVRRSLPVFSYREEFLAAVAANQVLIVVGETGSGKTTQLPQYLHENGYSKGPEGQVLRIGCTQPRRVAATSVAARVAEEMGVSVGSEVGYSVRFDDSTGPQTVVKYLTDGMLLREFLTDPELASYGALMIDEAHERTVSTEIILSLLKDIIQERPSLRLIVASATINAQKFLDFFQGAPIFKVPGRRFPVDIHYTKSPEANYIQAALTTIFQIHASQDQQGDILVFLTGQEEIEAMQESLTEACTRLGLLIKPLIIAPIYASLPPDLQRRIFEPTPPGARKVVLATNIAETSITIDGIRFVIDPGYVKENVFNPVTGMESLVVVPCLRASADQRAGRAGRVGPGKCFRLYTKWLFYHELQANPTPEILRVNLGGVVLLLLSFGITDLVNFDFMDPPSPETLIKSLELLYALGALNLGGQLTATGRQMADFPLEPMFSKCLISSAAYGVLEDVLLVIAMLLEASSLFYRPKDKKEIADQRKERFHQPEGDHVTLLHIWNQWQEQGFSSIWCQDNFVQYKTLKRVRDVREQLEKLCLRAGLAAKNDAQNVSENERTVKIQKAVTAGFFPNIARLSKMADSYRQMKKNQAVHVHPSSSLFSTRPPPKLVLYHELVLTSKEFMRNCMVVDDRWLAELAPHYYSKKELESLAPKKR